MSRLRIISGEFGGRFISADVGRATQPMGDRVRTALFNMIDVEGARVLDSYAGSGAVGLEALSQGAKEVVFVDKDKRAQKVIAENIRALGVDDKAKLYKVSVQKFVEITEKEPKFDVIFADPPYHLLEKGQEFSTVFSLKSLAKSKGLMVLSLPGRLCVPTVNGVVVVDKRRYGEATLAVFRFE